MSHFSVAIITKGKPTADDIDYMLSQYDENKEVLHYIKKEELIANIRKEIEDYKNTTYADYIKNKELYLAERKPNSNHIDYLENIFPKKYSGLTRNVIRMQLSIMTRTT